MKNPLKRVEQLIPTLPERDIELAKKYLENRDFECLLEIVESDLYLAEKNRLTKIEEFLDKRIANLTELREELMTYMSYLEIPDNSNDYNYY